MFLLQELRNKAKGNVAELVANVNESVESIVGDSEPVADEGPAVKKPKFRNYQPFDKKLASTNAAPSSSVTVGAVEENKKKFEKAEIEDSGTTKKRSLLEEELEKINSDEINLVPKKINADLKQQIAPKLEKLKRRTQKAIVDILREKLSMEAIDE